MSNGGRIVDVKPDSFCITASGPAQGMGLDIRSNGRTAADAAKERPNGQVSGGGPTPSTRTDKGAALATPQPYQSRG